MLDCSPVVERYNMKLSVMLGLTTETCVYFDKCFKEGFFVITVSGCGSASMRAAIRVTRCFPSQEPDHPAAICFKDAIRSKVVMDLPAHIKEAGVRDVFSCYVHLDRMERQRVFAVMHW